MGYLRGLRDFEKGGKESVFGGFFCFLVVRGKGGERERGGIIF